MPTECGDEATLTLLCKAVALLGRESEIRRKYIPFIISGLSFIDCLGLKKRGFITFLHYKFFSPKEFIKGNLLRRWDPKEGKPQRK